MKLNQSGPVTIRVARDVKIYSSTYRGHTYYDVVWYDANGRRRKATRSNLRHAREEATKIAQSLSQGQPPIPPLTEADRLTYHRTLQILAKHKLGLDQAVATLDSALAHVDIHSLVMAARWFQRNQPTQPVLKSAEEVLIELLQSKEGRSKHTHNDLRRKLTPFVNVFRCPLDSLTTDQITDYMASLKIRLKGRGKKVSLSNRSRNNILRVIGTLFNFAKRKRYVSNAHPGTSEIEALPIEQKEVEVFTVQEMRLLLARATDKMVPLLVLGGFCGLRTEEIKKLDWKEVRFAEGFIEVRAVNAKTRVRRIPKMRQEVMDWIKPYVKDSGRVCEYENPANEMAKLARHCNLTWRRNGLRHSFISYRVAETENVAAVALEAGTSTKMIYHNYLRCVPAVEAAVFLFLQP